MFFKPRSRRQDRPDPKQIFKALISHILQIWDLWKELIYCQICSFIFIFTCSCDIWAKCSLSCRAGRQHLTARGLACCVDFQTVEVVHQEHERLPSKPPWVRWRERCVGRKKPLICTPLLWLKTDGLLRPCQRNEDTMDTGCVQLDRRTQVLSVKAEGNVRLSACLRTVSSYNRLLCRGEGGFLCYVLHYSKQLLYRGSHREDFEDYSDRGDTATDNNHLCSNCML